MMTTLNFFVRNQMKGPVSFFTCTVFMYYPEAPPPKKEKIQQGIV